MSPLVFWAPHLEPRVGEPVSRAKNHRHTGVQGPGNGFPMEVMLLVSAPLTSVRVIYGQMHREGAKENTQSWGASPPPGC